MSKLRYEHGLIQSFSIQSCTDPAKEMLIYLRTSPGYKLSDDVPTKVIKPIHQNIYKLVAKACTRSLC